MRFGATISAALAFAWPTAAFYRSLIPGINDVNPYTLTYPQYTGVYNISTCIAYNEPGVKSYWMINFLKGDDGHDYYIVLVNDNVGLPNITNTEMLTSVSLNDITTGYYFGATYIGYGNFSNTSLTTESEQLSLYASSPDDYSTLHAISSVPQAMFNLTYQAMGPNMYQGGGGSYQWGTGTAWAIDNPNGLPSGTITLDNKTINIVSNESVSWFDVQWGPGDAINGWYSFVLLMNDGTKIVTMTTQALTTAEAIAAGVAPGFSDSIVTFMYPNGHHEVYYQDPHVLAWNNWTSSITNITYFSNYQVNIPGKGWLNMTLPGHTGELPNLAYPSQIPVADSYCTVVGYLDGEPIQGFGNCERRVENATTYNFA